MPLKAKKLVRRVQRVGFEASDEPAIFLAFQRSKSVVKLDRLASFDLGHRLLEAVWNLCVD